MTAGRGLFRSVLSRLDAEQLAPWGDRRLSRGELVTDACFGVVMAAGLLWVAVSGEPWLVLASVAWLLLAADQYRLGRAAGRDRPR
ncbi:hypothetical protein LJR027_002342 [Terrabacter sp. LjRoot27]|uniref:hypothetical protein n=1 Tax=Terrabacter sp. LjRoot27 TaxID=3342306 RepID=UPI003ECCE1F0